MRQKIKKIILSIGYRTFKIVRKPIYWYQKIFKIKTRGVRVLLIHQDSLVLVRHWYNSWWVMPGGGIKKHETPEQAAIREIQEEVGLKDIQLEYQLGTYSNTHEGKNDTVYCFVAFLDKPFERLNPKFNIEIADIKMAQFSNLPSGVSLSTKQRISEYQTKDISNEIRQW